MSMGQVAKMLGVTPKTPRRCHRTKSFGPNAPHAVSRYHTDEIRRLLIKRSAGYGHRCVLYGRVASAQQSRDGDLDWSDSLEEAA